MKTFKDYINETKNVNQSIRYRYPLEISRFYGILRKGKDVEQKYIDDLFKNYIDKGRYRYFIRTVCEWYIKFNKRVPSEFIDFLIHFNSNDFKYFIKYIKELHDVKKRLPGILQRNPELWEYFI